MEQEEMEEEEEEEEKEKEALMGGKEEIPSGSFIAEGTENINRAIYRPFGDWGLNT